jgi:recombination protein RecA
MGYEDFVASLHPKVAAAIKTAQETEVVKLPLASYGLTQDLGGGIAKGRVCLVYGSTSSGKSALLQQSIGLWQDEGLVCAYVDVEGTWDKKWAARLGVKNEELILIQAKSSGRIEEKIRPLLENEIDVIVIDSISDILPEVFIDKSGEMNQQEDRKQIGSQAKAITALINGIHYLNKSTAIVLISQTTTFMGQSYVEQIPHGGQKTQFASSQIVRLTSSASPNSQIKGKEYIGDFVFEIPVGREVEYLVKKNKLGNPFKAGKWNFFYAGTKVGIDSLGEVIDEAVSFDIIVKGGAWFSYGELKWQGQPKVVEYFEKNPEELELVKKRIHTVKTGELDE